MTATVSLLPQFTGSTLPPPSVQGLSDDEQRLVRGLSQRLTFQSVDTLLRYAYYDGKQNLQNLGISIPPQLSGVRTVVDWPRIAVDPLVERCAIDGFRIPGATDVDAELAGHFRTNGFDGELSLAVQDALVAGRGYAIVGAPDVPGDSPIVTVESPLNLAVAWDPRTRSITAAYQSFEAEGVYQSVLYLPDQTIRMSREDGSSSLWAIDEREIHAFGEVPVVRLVNRARSSDREGRSEITAAVMNTTDSACRSLLGMEIAREFYSIPHRYILGAQESDFVDASGNAKSAMDMAISKFLAFERDEAGQVPQVGQFTAFDPSVFTKIVDEHAQLMASYTGFPPSYFGINATANPASADAIRVAENGIVRAATQKQRQFTSPLRHVAQLVWRFAHDGDDLPAPLHQLEVDWIDPATPTPAATTDAITKQVQIGAVPATSDVTLKRLGYSDAERARLAQDRDDDPVAALEAAVNAALAFKEARANKAVAADLGEPTSPAALAPDAPPPGVQSGR